MSTLEFQNGIMKIKKEFLSKNFKIHNRLNCPLEEKMRIYQRDETIDDILLKYEYI